MSEFTQYSQGGMEAGISALQQANTEFRNMLDELRGQLNSSLAQWDDQARLTYQAEQDKWNKAADRQSEIANQLPVLLGNISDGYNATERANASLW